MKTVIKNVILPNDIENQYSIKIENKIITEIKKGDVVELDNGTTTRKLRVLRCTNKEIVKEHGVEPYYECEIFDRTTLTRAEINAITHRENCLGTFLN